MKFGIIAEVKQASRQLEKAFEQKVENIESQITRQMTLEVPNEMRILMNNSPATGNQYKESSINGGTRSRVASSPGNPPRNQTFSLNKSFKGNQRSETTGEIRMKAYGLILDRYMDRPFIESAFETGLEKSLQKL